MFCEVSWCFLVVFCWCLEATASFGRTGSVKVMSKKRLAKRTSSKATPNDNNNNNNIDINIQN